MARTITEAYLAGEAGAFFPHHPAAASDRRRAVLGAVRPLDPQVADAIAAQNGRYTPSPTRDAHLAALRRGAAAVVTGQQVGLFLGPLFTIYKAAAAIRAARALELETGAPVVPVFWLQTEDHDLPEIARTSLPTGDGGLRSLQLPVAEQRRSVAHLQLPEAIGRCTAALREEVEDLPFGPAHLERIEAHYRPGVGWSEAFAQVLAGLFAEEGLVLVDPRQPSLAQAAAPVHRRALEGAELISRALLERSDALQRAGFSPAVHVREGAPLSFFHPQGADGPRYRLDPAAGGYSVVGGAGLHSREALAAALEADPLRFSTSALLRPILQDTLLPTAAYVGGPGELAYFAQLSPVYAAFDLPMPLVVPRARFRLLEGRTRRLLSRHGLEPAEVACTEEALLARCGGGPSDLVPPETLAASLLEPFEATLQGAALDQVSPALRTALRKTRGSVQRAVEKLTTRYATERLRQDEELVAQVRKLQCLLHPDGAPQEREHGLGWYAARYGERAFLETVLQAVRPFDGGLQDLEP